MQLSADWQAGAPCRHVSPWGGPALAQRDQATVQALTQEVVTTSDIEGEALNPDVVRSSVALRLEGGGRSAAYDLSSRL